MKKQSKIMLQHGRLKMKQWSVYFINSISVMLCIYILLQQMNEIYSYVIAISEDEIKGNTVTALHIATYDLIPEVGNPKCTILVLL